MQKNFLYLIVGIVFATGLHAQTQHTGWLASFNTFSSKGKTSIHFDTQLRSTDKLEHVQSFLLRTGFNVKLRSNLIATVGYAYIRNRRILGFVSGYSPEHRIWEQLLLNQHIGKVPLAHRLRLEQRFISKSLVNGNNELVNEGNTFANRLRYFARAVIPFTTTKPFTKGFFGALQNEVFVNIGDKSAVNGKTFDQNRAYLAIGYRVRSEFDLEAGYLNQYVEGRNGFTNNHVVQLAGYLRL